MEIADRLKAGTTNLMLELGELEITDRLKPGLRT
jgi:hypothetical protein